MYGRGIRKDRRYVAVRPDAEQQHVEGGGGDVRTRRGVFGKQLCVGGRGRVGVGRVVRIAHREDPSRVQGQRVEQRRPCLAVVAVGRAEGNEPLVPPPHVDPRPVDRLDGRTAAHRPQRRHADTATGQHHRRGAAGGLRVRQADNHPGGCRGGEQVRVGVDDDLGRRAHQPAAPAIVPVFRVIVPVVPGLSTPLAIGSRQMCSRTGERAASPLIVLQAASASA